MGHATRPKRAWPRLPEPHRAFLERALAVFREDARLVGVAAGGSFVTDEVDAHSDLDLVLAVSPEAWPAILDQRIPIAAALGSLLAAFTGEHVGEPRLVICLFGPPLLHVDLKFVSLDDAHDRVEDPVILWQRGRALGEAFARAPARYPEPDLAWIEERFWVWVHYTGLKIERGELFEALNALGFFRFKVLGPLALQRAGARPDGVRRVERHAPSVAARLARCVGRAEAAACVTALEAVVDLYAELRAAPGEGDPPDPVPSAVEREVRAFLAELGGRVWGAGA